MKTAKINILLLLFLTLFASCSNKDKKEQNTLKSGHIKVAIDQTMQNVFEELIYVFEAKYTEADIEPIFTTETEAIDLLKKDSVRFAVTARSFTPQEIKYFARKKYNPEAIRIAIDGIAMITNPKNTDTIISVKNLKKILTGKVTNWKEIFPKSKLGKIQVVFDNTKSSIVRYANDSICREEKLSKELNALERNEEVVKYVARNRNALGFIGVNTITNAKDSSVVDFTNQIHVMRVSNYDMTTIANSYQPYQYYLYTGDYPFRREIFILLNDPRGELPRGLTRFVSGQIGQRIIKKTGLLPSVMPVNIVNTSK